MRRILLAFLFAIPFFLTPSTAKAQCGPGGCGSGGGGAHPMYTGFYPKNKQMHSPVYGMFSFALCMYPRIHQHGPLYNYGPYEGYYPFAPYGPWNSDLTYNSPMIQEGTGHFSHLRDKLSGLGHHGHSGCSTCGHSGHYALSTLTNVFQRLHPHSWHKSGCSSCGSALLPTGGDVRVVSGEADAPVIRER